MLCVFTAIVAAGACLAVVAYVFLEGVQAFGLEFLLTDRSPP